MNPLLRIALIGCGSIGRRHLANLRTLTADRPTEIAVYDVSPQTRQAVGREFGVTVVSCREALWDLCPNVALICTPSHLHTPDALQATKADAAVFVEKPVAHCLEGLAELEAQVAARRLVTMVGCNMRFHPGPAQIKTWLAADVIGEILSARLHTGSYLPNWRPQQDYRASYSASSTHGGAILDCIHELDLALWLLGPAQLHSALVRPASSLGLQADGMAELLLDHASGSMSSVHLNFVQRNYERRIEVIGSEGTLAWDFNTGETLHYGSSGAIVQRIMQPAHWNINQMYCDELAYFFDCVDTGQPTSNTIATASQTLQIALQARGRPAGANL